MFWEYFKWKKKLYTNIEKHFSSSIVTSEGQNLLKNWMVTWSDIGTAVFNLFYNIYNSRNQIES